MTINACYPAPSETETEVTTFSHSISADQSAEGYAASDLLWCHHTFDPDALSDNHVVMTFAHAMHRLEITITNESGALPTDLQVAVRTATEVTMDFDRDNLRLENQPWSGSLRQPILHKQDAT